MKNIPKQKINEAWDTAVKESRKKKRGAKINIGKYTANKWGLVATNKERAEFRAKELNRALNFFELQIRKGRTPIEALTQCETSYSPIVFSDLCIYLNRLLFNDK